MTRTQWFKAGEWPARKGMYERKLGMIELDPAIWTGKLWQFPKDREFAPAWSANFSAASGAVSRRIH
jgi:hypothetical protein